MKPNNQILLITYADSIRQYRKHRIALKADLTNDAFEIEKTQWMEGHI